MRVVDYRFRSDDEIHEIDFVSFNEQELPARLREHGATAARSFAASKLPPLTLQVGGSSYTYMLCDGAVEVRPGRAEGSIVVVLEPSAFADLARDLRSTTALMLRGAARLPNGEWGLFVQWESLLRALFDGRSVHESGAVSLRARDGGPLDLKRTFRPGDDVEEMTHFLTEAGYLHLAGVFAPDEMAAVSSDIDRAASAYAPDDGQSWWASTADGTPLLVRLKNFQQHSARSAALLREPRYLELGDLAGYRFGAGDRVSGDLDALIKPPGIVQGTSDMEWHKDCTLGRHSYDCCSIAVAFSITESNADRGQLAVVAGSHRTQVMLSLGGAMSLALPDGLDLPVVELPTEIGDVTLHLSCTLHKSIAPKSNGRRVMYSGLLPPSRAAKSRAGQDQLRDVFFETVNDR